MKNNVGILLKVVNPTNTLTTHPKLSVMVIVHDLMLILWKNGIDDKNQS